jgi:hypothetical protein
MSMKIIIASVVAITLAGCQLQGVKTGPLSDPEVLAQRCAELNLAVTAANIIGKVDTTRVQVVVDTVCGGTPITDYPSALNAIANALKQLRR